MLLQQKQLLLEKRCKIISKRINNKWLKTQKLFEALINEGFRIVSGSTVISLVAVDVKGSIGLTGKEAEETLDSVGITCNKNASRWIKVFCNEWYMLGTPAATTRGF